jgi:pimeloyl-ACP methyl ester carboxylesterase
VAELRGLIGRARVHRYPYAGHSPYITHPQEYVAVVTAFAAAWREVAGHA